MKIGILTSSRADYGIYRPLLRALESDGLFEVKLIAFGSHLWKEYGHTIDEILADGFSVDYRLATDLPGNTPAGIARAMASVTSCFADFWKKRNQQFDLIFCLGDRYEIFAAVQAGVPFNIRFAHIHGGETTLGAIDNIFRHCLSVMSAYHFTSHKDYTARVRSLTDSKNHIYTVGALGLDNVQTLSLMSKEQIKTKYEVDLSKPSILFTFHPETVNHSRNKEKIEKIVSVLEAHPKYQVIITGTNADTHSEVIRKSLKKFAKDSPSRVFWYESLGTRGYYSFMKWCSFLMGNTSSGIIEAASFGKYVIDLGQRQQGRLIGKNVFRIPVKTEKMNLAINFVERAARLKKKNIYWQGGAAKKIVKVLKKINE